MRGYNIEFRLQPRDITSAGPLSHVSRPFHFHVSALSDTQTSALPHHSKDMSSSKDSALYNQRPHNINAGKAINSSTTLAFTSQLSSLISTSSTTSKARPKSTRLKPRKDDLFARSNRSTAKRAKRDAEDSPHFEQKHTTHGEGLDRGVWERSKRKMEEKARLYAAMKRGDVEDEEGKYGVDFERKWAESQNGKDGGEMEESEGDEFGSEDETELVEYTDEFGRNRRGTKAEAARVKRMEKSRAELSNDRYAARPSAPSNVIYGDTIQHEAFDPDAPIAAQMDELAKKRDKSATPPPEEHFDGKKEVRSKGMGFFQFSGGEEERKRQMEGLEAERSETERIRAEKDWKAAERKKVLDDRRAEIAKRRGKRKADDFLYQLGAELEGGSVAGGQSESILQPEAHDTAEAD